MTERIYIQCWRDIAFDSNARMLNMPATPALAYMHVDITHENLVSDPFPPYTHFIGIKADGDCAIDISPDPEADPDFNLIDRGERLFYGVQPGFKLAVIEVVK